MNYDPTNWYWIVSDGPAGQVYSSARFAYVPLTDAIYLAWLAAGGVAPTITVAELRAKLAEADIRYLAEPLPPLEELRPRVLRARCRLQIATFSVLTATGTAVPWDTELVDPLDMHGATNPDRIVIPETGWYQAHGGARFASNGTGYRAAQLRIGASQIVAETSVGAAAGRDTVIPVGDYFQATAGAFLRMFVEQNSGVSLACGARVTVVRVE